MSQMEYNYYECYYFPKIHFDIMTENNYNVNKLFGIQTQKMRDTHAKKLYTPKNTSDGCVKFLGGV